MLKLAGCLTEGIGCRKDLGAACAEYERMIEKWDDSMAMLRLGQILVNRKGGETVKEGIKLVNRAADAGNLEARELVDRLKVRV
jgi:TPR repeat protein